VVFSGAGRSFLVQPQSHFMEESHDRIIAFLGDSITAAGRWDQYFPNRHCRNFGVNGDCSDDVLRRLTPVIESRPEKLFLMIGTNDLGRGRDEQSIVTNVASILDALRTGLPDCRIHLQTALPREAVYADRVKSLNRRYEELARQRQAGVTLIDLFPLFDAGNGSLRGDLTADSLHLVNAAYDIWRTAILPYVS
jgi:lysophospholipase L1-like esterase